MDMNGCLEIPMFLAILDMKHVFSVFRALLKNTHNLWFLNALRGLFEEKCGCKKAHFCAFLRAREGEMQAYERTNLLKELEERLLPLRLALLLSRPGGERKGKRQSGWTQGGWIREMRQAIGMPVDDLARRMGVKRREVNRMVRAEENERIMLATLRRAAEGLGCELVYGLVPKEGTVKELAEAQTVERKIAAEKRQRKLQKAKQPLLEAIGWEETWMQALRASMRRDGYRVRSAKTDRNVKNQIEEFGMKLKMLEMAGALGPFVKKYLEGRDAREREGAADKAG